VTTRSESELAFLSIEQAAGLLRKRALSPLELVEAALGRIERFNSNLHAFLTILTEQARQQAKRAEREMRRGETRGPLHGIPISLKDNFYTRGIRTTAGSKILADFVPDADSQVARSLAKAGAILLGKTNMHEFAYGITGENPHYGSSRNPWAPERVSGGSSGGSAVAVATGMGLVSVGTDTGGSIRIPAALCGIVGLKPTFGLVSVEGVVPLGVSFDHVGPLARTVADASILLKVIAGKYPRDEKRPSYRNRFRLGWPRDFFFERIHSEIRSAIEAAAKTFETLGARIEEISFPQLSTAVDRATNVVVAEANSYHESQGYFPARSADYGDDVRGHLEWGHNLRAVDYLSGLEARRKLTEEFTRTLERVDAILAPVSPIPAPPIGQSQIRVPGERETTVRAELLRLTRPANIVGLPAISIPCGFTREGLPIGLQLVGPRWGEPGLLAIAQAYEEVTDWHSEPPIEGVGFSRQHRLLHSIGRCDGRLADEPFAGHEPDPPNGKTRKNVGHIVVAAIHSRHTHAHKKRQGDPKQPAAIAPRSDQGHHRARHMCRWKSGAVHARQALDQTDQRR
jgi:aspartyl-tRNA(Asn)/glutamyl-tRNA(Gln) amidotransferase subunit A